MTVSAQTPINRSTGNGVTTVFPYDFKILAAADIQVTVDGVAKTLNVDYTVSGVGNEAGGNVTMTVAPANLTSVVRRRNMALVRTTDYQDQGELPAATLDADIDAAVLMIQQVDEQIGRALTLPAGVVGVSAELPEPVAFTLLGWNDDGSAIENYPPLSAGGSDAALVTYQPAGSGSVAMSVRTKLRESVSVKDFGAVGDGVADDYAAIMAAHDALPSAGGEIRVPRGSYLHNTAITFSKNIRLVGEGTAQDHRVSPSEFVKGAGITTTGVTLTGNGASVQSMAFRGITGNTGDGVCLLAARQVLRDVGVFNMGGNGVRVGVDSPSTYNCNLWYIENLHSKNNGGHGLEVSEGAGALADANGGTALHIDLQYNTGDGLYIRASQLCNYIGVTAQNNGAYGVHLGPDAKQNVIVGGDWEANTTSQLRIDNGADYNHITNQTIGVLQISYPSMGVYRNSLHLMEFDGIASNITFPSTVAAPYNEYTMAGFRWNDFTPTVSGATTAGAATTYVTRIGKYQRIGNVVHFAIQVEWSGGHTGTGNTIITGLPYAALNSGPITPVTIWQIGGPIPAAGTMRVAQIYNNTSQVSLRESNLTTMAVTNSNAITASGTFLIQGSYFIS